jgi:hypothetical protein
LAIGCRLAGHPDVSGLRGAFRLAAPQQEKDMLIGIVAAAALSGALEVRTLQPGEPPAKATIESAAFLVGRWVGSGFGGCAEESVLPAANGQMVGMFRQMKPDGTLWFYEFYTVVETDGSLVFRIKHFGPDLVGWEEKSQSVDFPLVAVEKNTAYFNGLSWQRKGDTLESAVAIGEEGEEPKIERFTYRLARKNESCAGK